MTHGTSRSEQRRLDTELAAITLWYEDATFREAVKADPKAALETRLDLRFDDAVRIRLHWETTDSLPIRLPQIPTTRTDLDDWQIALGELYIQAMYGSRYKPLLEASLEDQGARQRLNQELGIEIPEDFEITVYRETENDLQLSIPNPCIKELEGQEDLSANPRDFWILTLLDLIALAFHPPAGAQ